MGSPEHILGSALTKHGEIAEHAQVNISNARRLKEETGVKDRDQKSRYDAYQRGKPSLEEGVWAASVGAAAEGGMGFCLGVAKKLNSGKKLNEFTEQDLKDIGIDTAKGTAKGAIRGASVYGLTNFTATPAAVASSFVTAVFGVAGQALSLRQGKISNEDFIVNSEVVCLDVTVSAIASVMGQALIPVPVLGALMGNAVGMFMYEIGKNNLSEREQALIAQYNDSVQKLNGKLNARHMELIETLRRELAKFKSLVDFAFDLNVNIAFAGSAMLALYAGCPDEKILKDKEAIDAFFLN
ncbi:MAG: hypothetical protein LBK98_08385 [Peptococcaceae bacterium]|nr:hypothetical protein [Peptococcaceae bacterium]